MAWFRADDKLTSHRKFMRLGRRYGAEGRCLAMGLWVQAGTWSALNETNGFIPADIVEEFAPVTPLSHVTFCDGVTVPDMLCDVGFWSETDDGYQFEGWDEYQPTKQGADEKRANDAERKRRSRARKKGVTGASQDVTCDQKEVTACPPLPSRPVPSRPDPIQDSRSPAPPPSTTTDTYPADFEAFWKHYPRKSSKRKALAAWQRARKRATNDELIAGAIRYRDDPNREDRFTKHGESWLNGDCWTDDPLPDRTPRPAPQGLTSRQQKYLQAELLKDNPDPRAIQLAEEYGYGSRRDRAAAAGGAGLRQPEHRRPDGQQLASGVSDRPVDAGDGGGGGAPALRLID